MVSEKSLIQIGSQGKKKQRHPPWLKVRAPFGTRVQDLKKLMARLDLHTVCKESLCPNIGECWNHGVATFMILGDVCTRGCRYCAVTKGVPQGLDLEEPHRIAEAVEVMGLRHVVITSVDRDDLPDGGASIFAETVRQIRKCRRQCVVELLVPDFKGSEQAIDTVLSTEPEVLSHNVETVPRLYPVARGGGKYKVSLRLLEHVKSFAPNVITKTGLMLGLGETPEEIREVLHDLVQRQVSILTVGQYLQPSGWHLPVQRYVHPQEFYEWKEYGESKGLVHVESGPLVRSSYLADQQYAALKDLGVSSEAPTKRVEDWLEEGCSGKLSVTSTDANIGPGRKNA